MAARTLGRHFGTRRFRKIFVVASEGKNTEPQYFGILKDKKVFPGDFMVVPLPGKSDSSPPDVLERMRDYLEREAPDQPYEAWLVVDKDDWKEEQLAPLVEWVKQDPATRFLALSNPKFEYWLLLHFEEGDGVGTPQECDRRLAKCPCGYDKHSGLFNAAKMTRELVEAAVKRAKKRDSPQCRDWPRKSGQTTVYRLVEKILEASETGKGRGE